MDFGAIIKRSWHITWRYRALWVLGLFAGVSGCQGGGGSGGRGGSSYNYGNLSAMDASQRADLQRAYSMMVDALPLIIGGLVLLTIVGIAWSIFGLAARGGLVTGVNGIEEGRELTLRQLWGAGFARFWTLVGLDVLLKLPILVVALFVMVGIFVPLFGALAAGSEPGAEIVAPICGSLGIGIPVLLVLSLVLGMMYVIALRYVMLGGQGAMEAAGNSWKFIRARLKDTFLMWLINAGLNIAASLVIAVPIVIITLVFLVPVIGAGVSSNWGMLAGAVAALIGAVMLVSLAYSAIWGTYTSALWTLFFRQVAGMAPAAELAAPVAETSATPVAYPAEPPAPPMAPPPAPPAAEPPAPPMAEEPPAPEDRT